jgi:hypothetical protein
MDISASSALAARRADLLVEVAGILRGTSEGELDEPVARSAARLCRQAGADPKAIPAWIQQGSRRSANPDARRSSVRDERLLVLPADAAPLRRQGPHCQGPPHL